jgi:hypothetical protein
VKLVDPYERNVEIKIKLMSFKQITNMRLGINGINFGRLRRVTYLQTPMVLEQNSVQTKTFWPKREKAIQKQFKTEQN